MRPLSTEEFDAFVEGIDYPVFVVTTASEAGRAGCLVGFTTQTSISPPRLLVCLSEANHTLSVAHGATHLAVHLLDSADHPLAELFGGETGDEVDKFASVDWEEGPGGVPLLADCRRRLVGRVLLRIPLGDHVGHLLEPVAVEDGSSGADVDVLTVSEAMDIDPGHPA